ncbi:MAG: hypothetical protein CMA77_05830 [Euryarchaeota archaeon]|nr:hypothetical protein [Euryarchaeota archaeon]|tara:strand:- start:342 stop:1163 length:822 start_codon:yes stop_codon:yes gene_type:complete
MGEMRVATGLLMSILFLMAVPASIADVGDTTIMQQTGEQPSHENNTFYLWGQSSGTPCWGHFNNSDDGSANDGYAEKTQANGKMEIEWTCRMDPQLAEDFALQNEAEIQVHLMIDVSGDWENGQGSCQNDCENLNISLMKGGLEVAKYEYTAMSQGENEVAITFPVNETLQLWDDATDNPGIRVRMVLYATTGIFCAIPGVNCDAEFRMYFSGQEEAQYNGTVTFPILNESASEEILGPGDMGGDEEDEGMPGFGIFAAAAAIGIAALSRRDD